MIDELTDILQYTFAQHALLGSLLVSVACALAGTYIVSRRLVFISGGLTHASFGGVGIGIYCGIEPVIPAALFAIVSAMGIQWMGQRRDLREDAAIAMFWTLGMAVGIVFTYLTPQFSTDISAYLFGNILTIGQTDLWFMGGVTLLLVVLFALFMRTIVFVAFDREFALLRGMPVVVMEYILMALTALTIVACLRIAGIVLAISLLTIPQTTAALFTHRFGRIALLSAVISLLCCLGGLVVSYFFNIPSGATIIFLSIAVYAACWAGKTCRTRWVAQRKPTKLQ